MMASATIAKHDEVGGMAFARVDEGFIVIDGCFMLPQEVSSGEVDYEHTEAMRYAIDHAIAVERLHELRVQWHSHGSMGTFFSTKDEDAIVRVSKTGLKWLVNIIVNNKGEFRARLDQFECGEPWNTHVVDLDLKILRTPGINTDAQDQFDRLVKKQKPQFGYHGYGGGGQFGSSYFDDDFDWNTTEWDYERQCWVTTKKEENNTVKQLPTASQIADEELRIQAIQDAIECLVGCDVDFFLEGRDINSLNLKDWEDLMEDFAINEEDIQEHLTKP
jgi:hypothetical protein